MKKQLLIISITVIIVSIFISCSANISSETVSTVSVKNESTETVTDSKGEKFTTESVNDFDATENEATSSANYDDYADTDVEFTTTESTTISATAKSTSTTNTDTTKSKTTAKAIVDKDGWINKWY